MFRGAISAGVGSIGIRSSGGKQPGTNKGAIGTTATTAKPRVFFSLRLLDTAAPELRVYNLRRYIEQPVTKDEEGINIRCS